jgi:hypothetical protein
MPSAATALAVSALAVGRSGVLLCASGGVSICAAAPGHATAVFSVSLSSPAAGAAVLARFAAGGAIEHFSEMTHIFLTSHIQSPQVFDSFCASSFLKTTDLADICGAWFGFGSGFGIGFTLCVH